MGQAINKALYPERRTKERINCDYPAMVQGHDPQGNQFSENGRVINLSASGIMVVARQPIQTNTEVVVRIAFPTGSLKWGTADLSTKGNVIRSEVQSDGKIGLGIKFHDYKFM
jgi:hypothetical protein